MQREDVGAGENFLHDWVVLNELLNRVDLQLATIVLGSLPTARCKCWTRRCQSNSSSCQELKAKLYLNEAIIKSSQHRKMQ